jgi:mono/diheme cytochrome c family protein
VIAHPACDPSEPAFVNPTMLFLVAVALVAVWPAAASALPAAKLDERHRQLLSANCFACHGLETQEAGVRLDDLPLTIATVANAERWQKVLNVINSGEMPPKEEPQLDPQAKLEFLAELSQQMVVARKALADQGGRITMRRLSRREYANTIQDLLGVEPDLTYLPEDGKSRSFDTVGSNLFMSADQVEQYLAAGRKAIDDHFVLRANDPKSPIAENDRPTKRTIRIEPEANAGRQRMLSFEKWIAALEAEVEDPKQDELELAKKFRNVIAAREQPGADLNARFGESMNLAEQWEAAGLGPKAADFGFKDVQDAKRAYDRYRRSLRVSHLPQIDGGLYLQMARSFDTNVAIAGERKGRRDDPAVYALGPGRYVLRVRAGALPDAHPCRRFINVTRTYKESPAHPSQTTPLSAHHVAGTVNSPQVIEVPLWIQPGTNPSFLSFSVTEKRHESAALFVKNREGGDHPVLWIDWIEIEGPLAEDHLPELIPASIATLPEPLRARAVIEAFAARAFRGQPVGRKLLHGLVSLYEKRRVLDEPFEIAIRRPLSVILASTEFLYLAEPVAEGTSRPLTDVELANRLAYFLWSGPPDDELLALARRGKLRDAATLDRQVTRLLADPRLMRSVEGFAFQWLHLDRLDLFQYPGNRYLFFDRSTRETSRREVYETYADMLRHGRPLGELLTCDSVVVNGLLGAYYGLDGVIGDQWRRVRLPAGSPRGGFLGMAAIMAMGSNGTISSPTERGAWVLRTILHDPPPPAPPNVPQITNEAMLKQKPRERITIHQKEPQCASCHRKIDPIGFGLENFDAAGRWRDVDSLNPLDHRVPTFPIDASGEIYGGPQFKDYFGLRDFVAARIDDFARGHVEALIQFALGRPVGFSDEEFVARIVAQAKQRGFKADAFVRALVTSPEFQTK